MKLEEDLYMYPWTNPMENNCNTYLIDGDVRTLVDPGHRHLTKNLWALMANDGFSLSDVDLVVLTHAHPDHMEAAELFHKASIPITMHEAEEAFLRGEGAAFFQAMGGTVPDVEVEFQLQEGSLRLGGHRLEVVHTPGHSPGSICLYWPDRKALITGDLIFRAGIGRTDFPGCSGAQLKDSILKVSDLDVELVLPGHGDLVQGKDEVLRNLDMIRDVYFSFL